MDKEERGQLLRQRFKANGGFPFIVKGVRKPKREREPRLKVYMPWPDIIVDDKRTPGWMKETNEALSLTPHPERRRKGETALTRMARTLLVKPKRLA